MQSNDRSLVYFAIVGTMDTPIYELECNPSTKSDQNEDKYLNQFALHSALDLVEDIQWTTNSTYLKVVDKFNAQQISVYITPGGIRLMILHDNLNSDNLKSFFGEVHEMYIKTLMNPFYEFNSRIDSIQFDLKVKGIARKYI